MLGFVNYVDARHGQRRGNSAWRISYHSEEDKKRIKKGLKALDFREKNYEMFEHR